MTRVDKNPRVEYDPCQAASQRVNIWIQGSPALDSTPSSIRLLEPTACDPVTALLSPSKGLHVRRQLCLQENVNFLVKIPIIPIKLLI